jgi:hypothetical protein
LTHTHPLQTSDDTKLRLTLDELAVKASASKTL